MQNADAIGDAEHNLHVVLGEHDGKTKLLGDAVHSSDRFEPLIAAEREALRAKNPNRPMDHTSLGVMLTDAVQKRFIEESFRVLKPVYGPWNPARVVAAWKHDDFGYVGRLRTRSRFTPARFKAR